MSSCHFGSGQPEDLQRPRSFGANEDGERPATPSALCSLSRCCFSVLQILELSKPAVHARESAPTGADSSVPARTQAVPAPNFWGGVGMSLLHWAH